MSKKDEDSGVEALPFASLDKTTVLQEARIFNESPIKIAKCCNLLAKILYMLTRGETFTTKEATELFFSVTKLFLSKDIALRRMVYLVIKELSTIAEDVIMVTSSLTKDINSKADTMYRANAIRSLCTITDPSMLQGIERFLKEAIVDKNPNVASAAIVSSLHLFNDNREVVKRWVNEVQEAVSSRSMLVQYHALGLLYQIRQHDRMAVTKLVQNLSRGNLRSPFAQCMLIRYAVKVMDDDDVEANGRSMYDHLESCLRYKSDMVIYEAARAICQLKDVTAKELAPVIPVLQAFLSSPKPTLRFAAIRTLNTVALTHPNAVSACNLDMENLVMDQNRSIAIYAITTLLKTGNESSVDRLMKTISGFMSEISDDFKIIVVDAIRTLCLKFPAKHSVMLGFLSNVLRQEGGFDYQKAIIDAIFDLIKNVPECKETALIQLCEYIEDCNFPTLSVRVLHLLGQEGPKAQHPTNYIRYIYNRIILENSTVRAAAVSALAKFASTLPNLKSSILVLLARCLNDTDDEVRDRATFALRVLSTDQLVKKFVTNEYSYSFGSLELALLNYRNDPAALSKPFDINLVPIQTEPVAVASPLQKATGGASLGAPGSGATQAVGSPASAGAGAGAASQDQYAEQLSKIPQLAALGPLLRSSKPVPLTEQETEYMVQAIKHIFPNHIVLHFVCKNTLHDQQLENVTVQTSTDCEDLAPGFVIKAALLKFDVPSNVFVVYRRRPESFPVASFGCTLKFIVKDCDPQTGEADEAGYDDEYAIESLELNVADYVQPSAVSDFKQAWEEFGADSEVVDTFVLTALNSLQAAVKSIIDLLGMQPCERTGTAPKDKNSHTLLLAGIVGGNKPVVVRAQITFESSVGVTMKMAVRSQHEDISRLIASAIS